MGPMMGTPTDITLDDLAAALEPGAAEPLRPETISPKQSSKVSDAESDQHNSDNPHSEMLARMFEMRVTGLYRLRMGDKVPECFVCGPFEVLGVTRDAEQTNFGLFIRWKDKDGLPQEWALPMDMLAGDGVAVRSQLLSRGLWLGPSKGAREALLQYLTMVNPSARWRCVDRIGWHNMQGASVYALPDATFGTLPGDERIILQHARPGGHHFTRSGTLDGWRSEIAAPSQGNSRLVLAISAAFAASVLDLGALTSGGINFRGASQTGKSTTLKVAGSVWGGGGINGIIQNWRATSNGLEAVAAMSCDALLCLDEMGQADPKEIGETAYMLANGSGKTRAGRDGSQRKAAEWRVLFLSTGEVSLADMMLAAGQQTRAGQEVRLVDVPADAGKGIGIFERLGSFTGPGRLADHLNDAVKHHYGAPIRAFLGALTSAIGSEGRANLQSWFADEVNIFLSEHLPDNAAGQVRSVAKRFAVIGAAGELATRYSVTGWPKDEAMRAAALCFAAWLEGRGSAGMLEDEQFVERVRAFIGKHGGGRFERIGSATAFVIQNRAGFVFHDPHHGEVFGFLPDIWKSEVLAGLDAKRASKELLARGWLIPGQGGKASQSRRIPGQERARLYCVPGSILSGAATRAEARNESDEQYGEGGLL
jgi:putative DNA primase/helicase